jgi:hypothetical protein
MNFSFWWSKPGHKAWMRNRLVVANPFGCSYIYNVWGILPDQNYILSLPFYLSNSHDVNKVDPRYKIPLDDLRIFVVCPVKTWDWAELGTCVTTPDNFLRNGRVRHRKVHIPSRMLHQGLIVREGKFSLTQNRAVHDGWHCHGRVSGRYFGKPAWKTFPCQFTYNQWKFKLFPSVLHWLCFVRETNNFSVRCPPSGLQIDSHQPTLPTRLTFSDGSRIQCCQEFHWIFFHM